MQFLRKILFYLFTVLYLILCPLIILYIFGYIFAPQKLEMVRTGLIYLSSLPEEARIHVEKSVYAEKTPTTIQELVPGEYTLQLSLKNYKIWSHLIKVDAGKAAVFDKILLIPQVWPKKELFSESFKDLIPLAGTHYFFLSKTPLLRDYYIYNEKDNSIRSLTGYDSRYRKAVVISRHLVAHSSAFIFYIASQEGRKYLWFDVKDDKITIKDLTDLFPDRPQWIEWDPKDITHIFSSRNNTVTRIDINTSAFYPKFLENVHGYGIHNRQIYVLNESNALNRFDYDKKSRELLFDSAALSNAFFERNNIFRIEPLAENTLFFLADNGEFVIHQPAYESSEKQLVGREYDAERKRFLFWQKDKIGSIDFSEKKDDEVIAENKPSLSWLLLNGKNIKQCYLAYRASHVIFTDADGISLLEIAPDGNHHIEFIARHRNDSGIFYSDTTGMLYFLDPDAGRLMSVEILPRGGLIPAQVLEDELSQRTETK